MRLNERQLRHFHTFGYLIVRKLLSPGEVEWVTEEFEWSIRNRGGGSEHDGSRRTMFGGPVEHTRKMCTLLDHPGVRGLIGGEIGEGFNYCSGDGNYYAGDTKWHPDGNWGQLWATKTAFYLDELRAGSGCLRVIPGSHHPGHFVRREGINPNDSEELFGVPGSEFPGNVAIETDPGDVVIFNHDLYHASFGGGGRRRMFTMNCTRHARTPEEHDLARQYLSVHSPGRNKVDTGAGMFYPTMVDTADESRMVHLRQAAEIHDELFPEFARR